VKILWFGEFFGIFSVFGMLMLTKGVKKGNFTPIFHKGMAISKLDIYLFFKNVQFQKKCQTSNLVFYTFNFYKMVTFILIILIIILCSMVTKIINRVRGGFSNIFHIFWKIVLGIFYNICII